MSNTRSPLTLFLLACALLLLAPTPVNAGDEDPLEARLSRLLEQWSSTDPQAWTQTRKDLSQLGAEAVPALTRALSSEFPHVRSRAAEVLQLIGSEAEGAGPALAENLIDDQLSVRMAAAVALGHVDPDLALKVLPALLASPLHPKEKPALWQGLAAVGQAAAPILRKELMRGRSYRQEVFAAVAELGPGGTSVVRALIADRSWHVRLWSIQATLAYKELPATLSEAIANASEDEADGVAAAATWRMAQAVPTDPWFIPHLARRVSSRRVAVRRAATYGLFQESPWDSSLVVPLLKSVRDPDRVVRVNSALGLARFESHQAEAKAALAPLLGDEQQRVRIAAAWSLVRLGDDSAAPAPGLIEAVIRYGRIGAPFRYYLHRPDLGTGGGGRKSFFAPPLADLQGARKGLLALGQEAIPAILHAVTATKGQRRLLFVYALGHMGAPAIPALESLLGSKDLLVRNVAACCLAKSGARGKAAVGVLVPLAIKPDPYAADAVIVEAGEVLEAESVWNNSEGMAGATSWVRESHDALISIGAPALPALRGAGAADAAVAKRLAPVIEAILAKQPGAEK